MHILGYLRLICMHVLELVLVLLSLGNNELNYCITKTLYSKEKKKRGVKKKRKDLTQKKTKERKGKGGKGFFFLCDNYQGLGFHFCIIKHKHTHAKRGEERGGEEGGGGRKKN